MEGKKQIMCPKCEEGRIAVYETENEDGELLKIEGECQECHHEWLIAVKEMFR